MSSTGHDSHYAQGVVGSAAGSVLEAAGAAGGKPKIFGED